MAIDCTSFQYVQLWTFWAHPIMMQPDISKIFPLKCISWLGLSVKNHFNFENLGLGSRGFKKITDSNFNLEVIKLRSALFRFEDGESKRCNVVVNVCNDCARFLH